MQELCTLCKVCIMECSVIFLRIVVHITVSLFEGSMEYAFHNAHVHSI